MASPGLSEPKTVDEDARSVRRSKAVARVKKLSGSDKFEQQKTQAAPVSAPPWKNFGAPQ